MVPKPKSPSKGKFIIRLGRHEIQAPAVCAPVIGRHLDSMENTLEKSIEEGAEIIELRLDKLEDAAGWEKLLRDDVPTIVTNRTKEEGGHFQGSEKERVEILLDAIDSGAPCVDIELSTSEKKRNEVLKAAKDKNASVIISFHNYQGVPSKRELMNKTESMIEAGCDFAKLICFANDPQEALRVLDFLILASKKIKIPIISFAMGVEGEFTRIAAPLLGSAIIYAPAGEKTAPGQIDTSTTKKILKY
ncbi:hypothetical protein AKJ57_02220 [candidate division MSBL1 archaeon SCGC-AAA259A05]|uniref:3-dehydroquinate dehydratase n=1 Tax=candidate division MSBL1 archaeon SCGC-AAA259A05 TaxID=1698259 RepID=A0A133UAG2_9EURY|nr:hypothetical protein AKJ57_02220 [candidate division MSBL1 archaeon SCGC-AAA259A05]